MNLLVISQRYWPDSFRISDTCEELVKRGISVTVICQSARSSTPPELFENEVHNGVHLIRVKAHPRRSSSFGLYQNYRSFSNNAAEVARGLSDGFDLVLVNGLSPIMAYESGLEYARKFHKKILLYCLDLWPVSLTARNVTDKGLTRPIYQHYLKKARDIYGCFDRILVSSPSYEDYLHDVCNIPHERMNLLYQYADGDFPNEANEQVCRNDLVFTGNIGKAQDVETLIRAAKLVEKDLPLRFLFYGSGSDYQKARFFAKRNQCQNVFFYDQRPAKEIPFILAKAGGTLLSLKPGLLSDLAIPAKLQSYMAAGKPVIACAGHSVNDIIEKSGCGWCVPAGDFNGLARVFRQFCSLAPEQIQNYGNNGKLYSNDHFSREAFFQSLLKELYTLSGSKISEPGPNAKDSL
jgi:glycosyltransferase involved in cell wall biosynthesis